VPVERRTVPGPVHPKTDRSALWVFLVPAGFFALILIAVAFAPRGYSSYDVSPAQVVVDDKPFGPGVHGWQVFIPDGAAALPVRDEKEDAPADLAVAAAQGANLHPDGETFGTAVVFARNPVEAARRAKQQDKLTFLLHVSGNFEDSRFT
jgi:hypothetical protein